MNTPLLERLHTLAAKRCTRDDPKKVASLVYKYIDTAVIVEKVLLQEIASLK